MKRPAGVCIECGRVTNDGASYCTEHRIKRTRAYNNTPKQRAYRNPEYQNARLMALARWPQCHADTARRTCQGELTIHHIDHNNTNNSIDNLAVLCRSHHMALEAEYQRGEPAEMHDLLRHALEVRT